jgi:hypothetical protein
MSMIHLIGTYFAQHLSVARIHSFILLDSCFKYDTVTYISLTMNESGNNFGFNQSQALEI